MSLACAVLSALTLLPYHLAISGVLSGNLFHDQDSSTAYFISRGKFPELTDQENTMIAISTLVLIFSIIEIAVAVGSAGISDSCYQPPHAQESQVSPVCQAINDTILWKHELF